MKKTALFLAFALLVPLAAAACHCCPVAEAAAPVQIEKAPCHGCCTEGYELTRDCGTIQQKIVSPVSANVFLVSMLASRFGAWLSGVTASRQEYRISPPHRSPLSLSSVLRI